MPGKCFPEALIASPPLATNQPSRSELEDALHWAAEQLATHKPHRIVNGADPVDFELLRNDLEAVAKNILDPLIEAYDRYAADHSRVIEPTRFKSVVSDAIDGNAAYELEAAGEALILERREERAEASGQTWGNFMRFRG